MRTLSKKMLSIFLSVVLVLGIFSAILPTAKLIQNAKAESAATTYDYTSVLNDVSNDTSILDTRVWDVSNTTFGTDGLKPLGIWNAMGLDAAYGALGISHNFFSGTAVGAERNEIHPYIVYNVTPGTSFKLSSAVHRDSNENESVLSFYVSNDGVTWIPVDAKRNSEGVWASLQETYGSYTSYGYTIDNVGLKTNFVKVEYPMTMASKDDGREPSSYLLVYGVTFTPVESYAVGGQTLFEAKTFGAQKELYEEHFIAFPDFVHNGSENAATSDYTMLNESTWGDFADVKRRSYVAMVAPGSHFYLETANNWYMKALGEALASKGELESADKARIRVYSSATLSDDESAWTEHNPMPFSFGSNHTPTFNFYLPKDHIYVRIVYPQKGNIATVTNADGSQVVNTVGNDAAFFNDMVFTPYEAAEADYTYDYTQSGSSITGTSANSNIENSDGNTLGLGVQTRWDLNIPNDAAQNTGTPYAVGYFSATYAVTGGKMFNLEYAIRNATWSPGNTKKGYESNVTDGSKLEFIIESSADGSTWSNAYETESGYAETSVNDGDRRIFDVNYLVPGDAQYVRVSFGIRGMGYAKDNSTQLWLNDCMYIRKVSVANANNVYTAPVVSTEKEFVYTTDTDASKVASTSNAGVGSINGATGFMGDYGYYVGGDGNNVRTLAGTLNRPYVIYNVFPGSAFNFDYAMRATAKAASETTAAHNLKGGLGNESLKEYEFFVYGRANENSEWTYIGKTNSSALNYNGGDTTSYDTVGLGNGSFTVPAGINQVKVELPGTGAFTTGTPSIYDYSTVTGGDYWNADDKRAPLGVETICDNMITKDSNLAGLAPGWSLLDCAWGTKEFYLIYKVKAGTTFVANFTMHDAATRANYATITGETSFEAKLQYSADKSTWSEAITTAGQGTNGVLACTVPGTSDHYVKVTFPQKGKISEDIRGNDALLLTGVSFYPDGWVTAGNDAAYLYNVTYASEVREAVKYEYTTDTDASKAVSSSNTETASIDGATGFRGEYGYLVAGEGGDNTKTLAGTINRPYVIYNVIPGSLFNFDYSMYATAKAASETTAALNIKGGLGNVSLKEFEFFVYGRADENSAWTYIGKTDSSALDYRGGDSASYGTNGYGAGSFTVPAGITQVKVEMPQTGAFTTGTPSIYDYSTVTGGDYWNADDKRAPLGVDTICDNMITKDDNFAGLAPGWSLLDCAWGTKEFYLIYKVKAGTTFVANFLMHDAATRASYATTTGEASFEAKLQYSADKSTWSEAITTAGQGTNATLGCIVPVGYQYVKITFPQKGKISDTIRGNDAAILTGVSFYPDGWITAGNDAAYLYNVTYATGIESSTTVDYTKKETANIASSDKKSLNIYHHGGVSIVNSEGVKANSDDSFVIYKIKENSVLTVDSNDALSFEYSVDDITYKSFEAVKTCNGYEIPAITGRNYIKVILDNGEAITNVYAEVLAPTAKFYIPYLNKYELVDYANYGAAANSVSHTVSTLRPGYTFTGWSGYDDEEVYIDTVYEATFTKSGKLTYTVEWTGIVNGETKTQTQTGVKFDDRVTVSTSSRNSEGQVFSKWVDAKGVTVSNNLNFSFLASGSISLKAVYADEKEALDPYIYMTETPIITANGDGTWNLSVIWRSAMPEDVSISETGILLGKDVDKAGLILWDGKVQSGTAKMKHNNTSANKTAMYTVKNIKADAIRTALPYARLSTGEVIYANNVIKADASGKIKSAFEFKDGITPTVLNNYLDRAITYDAFSTGWNQSRESAITNTKDLLRQTGAKYLARGIGHWIPTSTDIYGENFTNYKNWIAEVHKADPEVVIEACIFETCSTETNSLVIPDWVQEDILGADKVQTGRTFNYSNMIHTWKSGFLGWGDIYGKGEFSTDTLEVSIPSISREDTQMFIYYRACTFIDMGVEAIHFGQMYRIGAQSQDTLSGDIDEIDYDSWTFVLDKIADYAKEHARRGYVLVNGHNEDQKLVRSDDSSTMLVDFNAYPLRIIADATSNTKPANGFQNVKLDTSSNAPYNVVVSGMKTPSGYTVAECYPYLLEFDNFGIDSDNKDKRSCDEFYVWGYDEISWYVNQQATYRHTYLTTISQQVKGLSAANGHVAMPGKRSANISNTGASEYYLNEENKAYYDAFYNSSTGCSEIPLWDIHIAGDLDAVKAAWTAIGSYNVKAE